MSYSYGSNVFLGATVASLSEEGANVDDNAIVNDTNYWESTDPADLSRTTDGVAASSEDGTDVAIKAFDDNSGSYWRGTSATNEWITNGLYNGASKLVNRVIIEYGGSTPRSNKTFTLYGTASDLAGGDSGWTNLGGDACIDDGLAQTFDIVNWDRHPRYRVSFADSFTTFIGSAEIQFMCWTPWITITPAATRTIRKISIKLHETDNANGCRIYGQDADGDWTLLAVADLANVTTAQDIILNTATSYPTYVIIFTGFEGAATHAKVDLIAGYEIEETEQTENVTGIDSGTTHGNMVSDNLLYRADPTMTVTSEATGYEKEYLYDKLQGATWRSTNLADQTIKAALDAAYNNHGIVLLGHNLDADLDTVTVEYSADDFTTIGASGSLTINDDIAYFISLAPLSFQYVRIVISTTGAVRSYFEIGQLFVAGGFYDFAMACQMSYSYDKDYGRIVSQSTGGQIFDATRYNKRIYSARFKGLETDQRLNFEEAERRGLVVFSPDGASGPVWFGLADFASFPEFKSGYWTTSMVFEESPA